MVQRPPYSMLLTCDYTSFSIGKEIWQEKYLDSDQELQSMVNNITYFQDIESIPGGKLGSRLPGEESTSRFPYGLFPFYLGSKLLGDPMGGYEFQNNS